MPHALPEAQIMSEEEDVVRIMTIHQAKGLEFPVVFVPDLAHEGRGERGSRVIFDEHWGVMCAAAYGINRARLLHPLMLEAELVERDKEVEEQKRLLYVALTRPKHLLVLGEGASKRPGPWHQWVMGTLLAEPERAEIIAQVRSGALPAADIGLGEVTIELRQAATLAQRPVLHGGAMPPVPTFEPATWRRSTARVGMATATTADDRVVANRAGHAGQVSTLLFPARHRRFGGTAAGAGGRACRRWIRGASCMVCSNVLSWICLPTALAERVRELIRREPGAFLLTAS